MLTILGIDPGTRKTGYGVIFADGNHVKCKSYGVIAPPVKCSLAERVAFIHKALNKIYEVYKPQHTAIEKIFFGKNPQVAFRLGHIFSSCLLQAQKHDSLFFEYASRFVKQNITSSGRASKLLVCRFVENKLSLKIKGTLDSADALAVALCHIQESNKLRLSPAKNREILKVR